MLIIKTEEITDDQLFEKNNNLGVKKEFKSLRKIARKLLSKQE